MSDEITPSRKLDRAALDRVLARAAELQSSTIEGGEAGGLSEAEIIELGKEAGMSVEHLRQAMAEERTRSAAPDDRTIAASIIGPATVRASRVVPGTPRELLDAIDSWMQQQESLKVKRRVTDRLVWEPRNDILAHVQRKVSFSGGDYALTKAAEVSATVTVVDANRTLVALDAGMASYRGSLGLTTGIVGGVGAGASIVGAVIGIFLPVALIPAVVAAPIALMASRSAQAKAVDRGQLALEQLLDHLERGDHRKPGGLLAAVNAAAANVLQGFK
jgi:hypothetical protein